MAGEEEVDFGLVMPFVVCASMGGPYDDEAFVAGYHLGMLDTVLAQGSPIVHWTLRTASMPQVDLIAMRHGYVTRSKVYAEDDSWTIAEFVPVSASVDGTAGAVHPRRLW